MSIVVAKQTYKPVWKKTKPWHSVKQQGALFLLVLQCQYEL
jgi:hypothetical protein